MTAKFVKDLQELCVKYGVNIIDIEGAFRKGDHPLFHELVIDEDYTYFNENKSEEKED